MGKAAWMAAAWMVCAAAASAHEGPKAGTVERKCEAEWDKQDEWSEKKHRRKQRPGHWSEVCGERPAPPAPVVQPPAPPPPMPPLPDGTVPPPPPPPPPPGM